MMVAFVFIVMAALYPVGQAAVLDKIYLFHNNGYGCTLRTLCDAYGRDERLPQAGRGEARESLGVAG